MDDALVVGGGPAGATAALLLARAGKAVSVIERYTFPRTKACGEYLSPGSVRLLYGLGVGAALAPLARPVRGVRLHGHGVRACIDFPAAGWSLPRAVLDDTLLNAAVAAGARLIHGRIEDCADEADAASVAMRTQSGSVHRLYARAVVGADGMHSLIARKSGLAAQRRPSGARFALGGHYSGFRGLGGYIDMFVDGESYAAVNPLSDTTANVMLVVPAHELEAHRHDVEAFARERAQELAGTLLAGARLETKLIAIGPLSYRARRLGGAHVVIAGDAACFLDPFTGQGVYLALRCADIAAQCLIAGNLRAYEPQARREIAVRERAAHAVSRIIHSQLLARASAALLERQGFWLRPLIRRVTGAA
jgi:flavin-dependent dehydrogenase